MCQKSSRVRSKRVQSQRILRRHCLSWSQWPQSRIIDVDLRGQPSRITLEISTDPSVGEWVSVSDLPPLATAKGKATIRCIAVRLSLAHPSMDRFGGVTGEQIEPLLRLAAAIGLARQPPVTQE